MPVQYRSKRIKALEQGLPALEACGDNVLVQFLLKQVMHGHLVLLAAFFVESQPPARSTVAAATIIGNGLSDGSSMLEITFSKPPLSSHYVPHLTPSSLRGYLSHRL